MNAHILVEQVFARASGNATTQHLDMAGTAVLGNHAKIYHALFRNAKVACYHSPNPKFRFKFKVYPRSFKMTEFINIF